MGITRKIWASRVKEDYSTFIAQDGLLFYNEENGTLRIGDGITPGGQPVNLLGSTEDLQLGNFLIDGSSFTTTELNANIGIYANGNGTIVLGGGLDVKVGSDSTSQSIFLVEKDGEVKILVRDPEITAGGVQITGENLNNLISPDLTGTMLHITGHDNLVSRLYLDAINNYPVFVGRRYNGTSDAPTAVLAEESIARYGCNAHDGTGFTQAGVATIRMVATENHTPSAKGTRIEFWTIPNGSSTLIRGAYINGGGLVADNLTTTGRANITNTNITSNTALLTVSANENGLTKTPTQPGTIAQFTSKDNQRGFLVQDGYGLVNGVAANGQYVFRTGRGTNSSPSAIQQDDMLGEIVSAGWGTTGFSGVSSAGIRFVATENFTDTSRGGKIIFRTVPTGSDTAVDALTITSSAINVRSGSILNSWITMPAGNSGQAPLIFTPGTLPTVPTPGAISYDGTAFYATPMDSQRGLIPTEQIYMLNAARNLTPNTTAAQSIFGKVVSLTANTRYRYEINLKIRKEGPQAAVVQYGILAGNGGSITSHRYWVDSSSTATDASVAPSSIMSNYITTGFNTPVNISAAMPTNSPAFAQLRIWGSIVMNAAGTVEFQIAFNPAPNQSITIQPASNIRIYPLGLAGADVNIGTWA